MKFRISVYEADKLVDEFEKEFENKEEADMWCAENYNTDAYAYAESVEE